MIPAASAVAGVAAVRQVEFPQLAGCTFLNAASFGPLPVRALRAADELLRMRAHDPERFAAFDLLAALDRARNAAARLVGAGVDEIALGNGTSFGLYLAATLYPRHCEATGRRIEDTTVLVSDREFPANVLPWIGLRAAGARVEVMPADANGFPDEARLLERIARGDVGLFAVSAVQFATGYRADLERFGDACRQAGALFVVDAIQAAGAAPLDVRRCAIDVLACGGQKWLLSPHGSGFVYVRRELCRELEPPLRGWLALQTDEHFNSLLDYDAPLHEDARRFELGSPAPQDLVPFAAAVEMLLDIGIGEIAAHIDSLNAPLRAWVDAHPRAALASPVGDAQSAIVCVALPDAQAVHTRLTREHVVCALREGRIRFSPHLYNTKEEMDGLLHLLERIA